MGVRIDVDLSSHFPRITDGILAGFVRGQNMAAEELVKLSAARAPMDDEGTLVGSIAAVHADNPGEDAGVIADTPYAQRWHEDGALVDSLGRRYPGNSDFQNNRTSHYFSGPAEENKDELGKIIAMEAGRG
ncbi:hypothetical protein [Cryobacterium arcticum]|uniref:HK97 gp10 family phage protein n=1 Tax=Cryobacterium arcticum TaxID=670052 RepID=A0A1B1BPP4_9MICO|nr:hypothetical protein [Cryobacterium arcticum]ANP74537.1 hypothetical protein PA27867_3619 [Cryobacterium arcticum]